MPCFWATTMRSSHCCALAGVDWHGVSQTMTRSKPVGMRLRQAERGRAAHRQAGEMRLLDRERVHQRDHVGQQHVEAVASGGRLGAAVPTLVVAQHADMRA